MPSKEGRRGRCFPIMKRVCQGYVYDSHRRDLQGYEHSTTVGNSHEACLLRFGGSSNRMVWNHEHIPVGGRFHTANPSFWKLTGQHGEVVALISGHVDDFLFTGIDENQLWQNKQQRSKERFHWLEWETDEFVQCDCEVKRVADGFKLDQKHFLEEVSEIQLTKERRKQAAEATSEKEKTELRGLLGASSWYVNQVGFGIVLMLVCICLKLLIVRFKLFWKWIIFCSISRMLLGPLCKFLVINMNNPWCFVGRMLVLKKGTIDPVLKGSS